MNMFKKMQPVEIRIYRGKDEWVQAIFLETIECKPYLHYGPTVEHRAKYKGQTVSTIF